MGKKNQKRSATQAKPLAEKNAAMSLEQIEERLLKSVLGGTLALYVLRSSRKPTSRLVNELLEIEVEVGQFVGRAMQMHVENLKAANLKGSLANALSFISLNSMNEGPLQAPPQTSAPDAPRSKKRRLGRPKSKKKKRKA